MKRGDITITENLKAGDRFYFLKDKDKNVWEFVENKNSRVNWAGGFTILGAIIRQPGQKVTEHVKRGREVVFLRCTDSLQSSVGSGQEADEEVKI